MNLHKDKKSFERIINDINEKTGFAHAIIEKDYFVTMILESLSRRIPNMIFKGGTSLSKCYHIIKRFSEDIDITVDISDKLSQSGHRKIKQAVVDAADETGLVILNLEDTRSRRDFNQYKIDYPSVFELPQRLKQFIFVETSVFIRSFPTEMKPVKSIIQEYLEEQQMQNIAEQYSLQEFTVRTQKLDRTLIDKLFALGDYYLSDKIAGHSRHVYDIYKLLPFVTINSNFKKLVKQVREVRKESKYCFSAHDGMDTQNILKEIAEKDAYKKDYDEIKNILIYDDIPYTTAKEALITILEMNIF